MPHHPLCGEALPKVQPRPPLVQLGVINNTRAAVLAPDASLDT